MKRIITIFLLWMLTPVIIHASSPDLAYTPDAGMPEVGNGSVTIRECVEKAEANYPLVKKYGLLEATREIDLSDINKGWLPRLGVYGQVTAQNIVPSFPESLTGIMEQLGRDVRGLGKLQYKLGVDLSQTVWDGGASKVKRELARSQEEVESSALDVELYTVRQRVENIYFAILLTEQQIEQSRVSYKLILGNLDRINAMLRNGTAMQSDADMFEAQALTVKQTITQAENAVKGYRTVLEIFTGDSLEGKSLVVPDAVIPVTNESGRPELKLFENRLNANRLSEKMSEVSLMPKVGLFAQAYYGYPGFNYFESMMNRNLSFNILAGLKISWNIDSFYTRKNNSLRTSVKAEEIVADRDRFLFNSQLQAASKHVAIEGLRDVIKEDARIVSLRKNVRVAAESQLKNGVIDATTLLSKISDENIALLNSRLHEIQLIQEIYNLKYILNK